MSLWLTIDQAYTLEMGYNVQVSKIKFCIAHLKIEKRILFLFLLCILFLKVRFFAWLSSIRHTSVYLIALVLVRECAR